MITKTDFSNMSWVKFMQRLKKELKGGGELYLVRQYPNSDMWEKACQFFTEPQGEVVDMIQYTELKKMKFEELVLHLPMNGCLRVFCHGRRKQWFYVSGV